MAFVKNDAQQIKLMDSTFNLTDRERRFLEKSWAKDFAEKIFPNIREEDFAQLYSSAYSRPNTPVNVIVGALILKEALGDTDDELVQALMFDIRYQYALHTTSFEEQPLSDRTLSRFRARCLAYETETGIDLIHQCVVSLAKEISDFMQLNPSMQRMDSLMIAAHIRNLSLLELFYTCVSNLAKIMDQRGVELPEAQKHYVEKDDYNAFIYHQRELDVTERTLLVMHDAETLLHLCNGNFDDTSDYQLLIRLLNEQTIFDDDGRRRLRKKEEIESPSKVLLNPSDPDATFRSKAGEKHIGYVGNITETVGENCSVITDYAYEQNVYSDSQ
ncbi:MAG: transposase, partial [Lachnospiraceae bacterium]|nr:transposase [Lachnospiraceae bacterium]